MSMEILLILMTMCAAFTGLVTEAIKCMVGEEKITAPNILAAVVSVAVACGVSAWYVIMHDIGLDVKVVTQMVVLTVLSWLCAMNGFDKVKQTIEQLIGRTPTAEPDKTEDDLK